jgi:hypothetical protein
MRGRGCGPCIKHSCGSVNAPHLQLHLPPLTVLFSLRFPIDLSATRQTNDVLSNSITWVSSPSSKAVLPTLVVRQYLCTLTTRAVIWPRQAPAFAPETAQPLHRTVVSLNLWLANTEGPRTPASANRPDLSPRPRAPHLPSPF